MAHSSVRTIRSARPRVRVAGRMAAATVVTGGLLLASPAALAHAAGLAPDRDGPARAFATTLVDKTGTVVTVTAGVGRDNAITVRRQGDTFRITDTADTLAATGACSRASEDEVSCPAPGTTELVVNAGNADDAVFTNIRTPGVTLVGGSGDDTLSAGGANDTIEGNGGDDYLLGGDGNDTVDGESGEDILIGGDGNDSVPAGAGGDFVIGGDGNDFVESDSGNDEVRGGSGNDYLSGQAGHDRISGDAGADYLFGGAGPDRLDGVDGVPRNDNLDGGSGTDDCSADPGDDVADCP